MYLWDDEGETALLAKNILSFGIPKTYDGTNFVVRNANQITPEFTWEWNSWLYLYVTSLSFSIFGFSTFSARILFVMIGIFSFFPIILLFKKISINKLHYYLSVLFLLFFVPYYLYSRQARYYALLIFLMPIIAISIYNLIFKNGSITWFVISFALLFHSNYLPFFILMMSASIYFFLILLKKSATRIKLLKKLVISYILIFLLTFPWAVYVNIFKKLNVESDLTGWIRANIDYILHSINSTVPIFLLIVSSIFLILFFYFKKNEAIKKQKIFFIFFMSIVPIILFIFPIFNDVRYLIGLFPLWILFLLLPIVYLIQRKENLLKIVGATIFLLLLFTNIFYSFSFYVFLPFENFIEEKCSSFVPEKTNYCNLWVKDNFITPRELKYPFFYYLYEITHDYDGPIEGIVEYLNLEGDENSIVFSNNWYFSIPFYTNMKILSPFQYKNTSLTPDFIVVNFPNRRDVEIIDYLVTYAEENNYRKVTLPYPDLTWDNRPVIWYHKFWTQPIEIPVTIYVNPLVI
tara:strand:- start:349 stop:1905 length:1557 start_codon:yes stop_codon:yes gene_type:complete